MCATLQHKREQRSKNFDSKPTTVSAAKKKFGTSGGNPENGKSVYRFRSDESPVCTCPTDSEEGISSDGVCEIYKVLQLKSPAVIVENMDCSGSLTVHDERHRAGSISSTHSQESGISNASGSKRRRIDDDVQGDLIEELDLMIEFNEIERSALQRLITLREKQRFAKNVNEFV